MNRLSFILLIVIICHNMFTNYVHVCHLLAYNFTVLVRVQMYYW